MSTAALRIAAAVLLALAWTSLAFWLGDSRGAAKVEAARSLDRANAAGELLAANRRVYQAGEQLAATLSQRDAQHLKEMSDARKDFDDRVRDLRTGALRVSIPVRAGTCPAPAAPGPTGTVDAPETRAELTPEAASALEGIAFDGDAAIIDLNTCIDRANDTSAATRQLNQPAR